MCGLKPLDRFNGGLPRAVTPCMGVWIETSKGDKSLAGNYVTPCMGVWIETKIHFDSSSLAESHPVWVCGLKRT